MHQQAQHLVRAGCFEMLLRLSSGWEPIPIAAILDSRTLQSPSESGVRVNYDGAKRRKGSKVHAAVDTLGHLSALLVTSARAVC